MDWIDKWNEALEMLEKSLTTEISLDDIARTACCTTFHFQRMQSVIGKQTSRTKLVCIFTENAMA